MGLTCKTKGILWAIYSSFWLSIMLCMVRYVSEYYNSYIIVFWRLFFSFILMLPWLCSNGFAILKTTKIKLYSYRAIIGIIAMTSWFYAVTKLPLPNATALSFTSPIFTTIAAIIFLKERPGIFRLMAIMSSFVGVLIIVRPGYVDFNIASLMVLFSTSLWALASILIKKLSVVDKPKLVTFYTAFMMLPFSFIFAIFNWQMIALTHVIWFVLIGFTANVAHNALAKSLSLTDVTAIMPYDFLRLVFIGFFTYFLFNDQTNIYDIAGSIIIIGSSIYLSFRENKFAKKIAKTKELEKLSET
ncbi:MAG: DMT family transporter [Rickettsiales bacterium]